MRSDVLGAVLAGGSSIRYGRDKWDVEVAGIPMGRRVVRALGQVIGTVVAVGSDPGLSADLGVETILDLRPGCGPLGGLHAALTRAESAGLAAVLMVGCDLPLVDASALEALLGHSDGDEVVIPEGPGGLEPLCAVYPVAIRARVEDALERGDLSLHGLAELVGARRIPVAVLERAAGRGELLLNVNRPEARMRAEALLAVGPPVVCVIGKKNSGKTTRTVALTAELAARGHRVMTVKHGHGFDLDRQGTDSWRHRHEGGAERVVLVGPEEVALVGGWGPRGEPPLREIVARYLDDADVVVAEGWKAGPDPKVEVYRSAAHAAPIYDPESPLADTFLAILTDREDFRAEVPIFSLDDPGAATSFVADLVERVLIRAPAPPGG